MLEDGDDILNLVGLALAVLIISGAAIAVLAAATAPSRSGQGPDAEFRFTEVNDSHVRVSFVAGEPIPASDLVVTVNGLQRQVTWGEDPVAEGADVVLTAREGSVVRVFWDPGEGQRSLLARYRVE